MELFCAADKVLWQWWQFSCFAPPIKFFRGLTGVDRRMVALGKYPMRNDPYAEWLGMPEYTHEDHTSVRKIIVHFKTAEDVERFARLIGQNVGRKLKSIWFPEAEIGRYADKAYVPDA